MSHRPQVRKWTTEDDDMLVEMYERGEHIVKIGIAMGRRRSSVDSRLKVLGVDRDRDMAVVRSSWPPRPVEWPSHVKFDSLKIPAGRAITSRPTTQTHSMIGCSAAACAD